MHLQYSNKCCWYTLELPHRGNSNVHLQHMFIHKMSAFHHIRAFHKFLNCFVLFHCNAHVEINKCLCSLACTWITTIDSQFYIIDSLSLDVSFGWNAKLVVAWLLVQTSNNFDDACKLHFALATCISWIIYSLTCQCKMQYITEFIWKRRFSQLYVLILSSKVSDTLPFGQDAWWFGSTRITQT